MSLIDDIRSGSNEAIRQLYQENAQDVYDFAKGITGNHDTAMQATKNTLSKLVQQIQAGNEPANLHSEALKIAYDEACKIAMPAKSSKPVFDEEPEAPVQEKRPRKEQKAPRVKEEYIDEYDDEEEDDYEAAPAPRRRPQSRDNRRVYEERRRPQPAPRRPRDDYYEDDYDDRYDDYDYDDYDDDYYGKKKHGAGFVICLIINIILVLVLIWFLVGLLINLSIIPDHIDLGYTWFDNHIYPLF